MSPTAEGRLGLAAAWARGCSGGGGERLIRADQQERVHITSFSIPVAWLQLMTAKPACLVGTELSLDEAHLGTWASIKVQGLVLGTGLVRCGHGVSSDVERREELDHRATRWRHYFFLV